LFYYFCFLFSGTLAKSFTPAGSLPMSHLAQAPPLLSLQKIGKRFHERQILADISVELAVGEFFSLLGPSGCGKTTLLRIIAGLDKPDSGTVEIQGRPATHLPPQQRPVNTVFQHYALFPHLRVEENIEFGPAVRGEPESERSARVAKYMQLLEIVHLAKRFPSALSGGEKQRVALARALINEPALLLLDEPLAALDAQLRKQLQQELRKLQQQLGKTFLLVTHDQDEALLLSDRIGILSAGQLEQVGTPTEIYFHPKSRFVAQFLGSCNFLPGMLAATGRDEMHLETSFGKVLVSRRSSEPPIVPSSSTAEGAIRPENLRVSLHRRQLLNEFRFRLQRADFLGSQWSLHCYEEKGAAVHALLPVSQSLPSLTKGQEIWIEFPAENLWVFEGSGRRLI
jgi:spermidine/putrescine transport system ATP-binding protein